jgi:hypothetical protein
MSEEEKEPEVGEGRDEGGGEGEGGNTAAVERDPDPESAAKAPEYQIWFVSPSLPFRDTQNRPRNLQPSHATLRAGKVNGHLIQ